jgi:hypothetical protein
MPPHLALYDGDDLSGEIVIAISGGEESDVIVRQIWNDKESAEEDTTTAVGVVLALLADVGAGFTRYGIPLLDERWFRVRVTGALGTAAALITGTIPLGTNSDLPLGDIPAGGGYEIELHAVTPGGNPTAATIKFDFDGNRASSPLSRFTALGTGSGVVPAERIAGMLSLLSGGVVTADDTDTVTVARGKLVAAGAVVAFPATSATFSLADGDAVNLSAGESYLVTLSRTSAGALIATKGPKAELVTAPATPAGNVLAASLSVASADGVVVTVAPSSVTQAPNRYAQMAVRGGAGLTIIVSRGEALTGSDMRQYVTNEITAAVVASATNRVWSVGAGDIIVTQTGAEPEPFAVLIAIVTTGVGAVTDVADARRLVHRALTTYPLDLVWRGVLTGLAEPSHGLALAIAPDDLEIEHVELNVTGLDVGLTADALKVDVLTVAPGGAVPFPAGGAGGTTIFTSSATDDARPSIDFDATNLRAVTDDHEVRRFPGGTRFLLSVITTVTGPGAEPEQEIRVTLHARRYR